MLARLSFPPGFGEGKGPSYGRGKVAKSGEGKMTSQGRGKMTVRMYMDGQTDKYQRKLFF
jgi:hypothetical protein